MWSRRAARRPDSLTGVTPATPLEPAPGEIAGGRSDVFLKREDVHELGAFKWRGALPVIEAYRDGGATAVVTASTGNHGAATAWAASRPACGRSCSRPRRARAKLELIERHGAEIRLTGADFDQANRGGRLCCGQGAAAVRGRRRVAPVRRLPGDRSRDPGPARVAARSGRRPARERRAPRRHRPRASASTRRPRSASESSRRKPR